MKSISYRVITELIMIIGVSISTYAQKNVSEVTKQYVLVTKDFAPLQLEAVKQAACLHDTQEGNQLFAYKGNKLEYMGEKGKYYYVFYKNNNVYISKDFAFLTEQNSQDSHYMTSESNASDDAFYVKPRVSQEPDNQARKIISDPKASILDNNNKSLTDEYRNDQDSNEKAMAENDDDDVAYFEVVSTESLEKARKEQELKERLQLNQKYGKKYVDALFDQGKILVGTPEGLIRNNTRSTLIQENQSTRTYKVGGSFTKWAATIKVDVRTRKAISVTYHPI